MSEPVGAVTCANPFRTPLFPPLNGLLRQASRIIRFTWLLASSMVAKTYSIGTELNLTLDTVSSGISAGII